MKKISYSVLILILLYCLPATAADVKISELPTVTATTPATDVVPIVASGVTSKVTVNNLLAAKLAAIAALPNGSGYLKNNGAGLFSYDTPSGTLSGTGVNHYWPYWTGATTLGAKSITASKPVCTDASGDPAVCTYAPIVSLFGSGTCSGYLKSDGTCEVPAGGGTVIGTGTNHYWPYWTSASELGSKSITASRPVCTDASGDPTTCTYTPLVTLWGSGSCSGYLKSDGTCDTGTTASVSDTAYNEATWDSVTSTAPSKNVIRDYLESKMPSGADGSYYLQLTSNTSISPTASANQIYFEANILKVNQNGTESSVPIGPTAGQITFTGPSTARSYAIGDSSGKTIAFTDSNITGSAASLTSGGTGTNPKFLQGSSLSAGTGSGSVISGTSLTAGRAYYMASGGLTLAKADSSSTLPAVCIADTTSSCMFSGVYKFSSTQSWTAGNQIYISAANAGYLVTTAPSTAGQFVQKIGIAIASDTILIMPSLDVGGL